jgi:hypothetical protein
MSLSEDIGFGYAHFQCRARATVVCASPCPAIFVLVAVRGLSLPVLQHPLRRIIHHTPAVVQRDRKRVYLVCGIGGQRIGHSIDPL